jgi:hypothetical protein
MRANKSTGKLDALHQRVTEMKAALEAVQTAERQQEKTDALRLEALVGAAVVADVAGATDDEGARRKTYISEALSRHVVAGPARAFLKMKGWL